MKGPLISLVLTALLLTLLFLPHQHISAESQNNSDEESNRCIGFQCPVVVDEEAELFMDQWDRGSSRVLAGGMNMNPVTPSALNANKAVAANCPGNYGQKRSPCLGNGGQYGNCAPTFRDSYCPRRAGKPK